jgi:hypothetical protein
MGFFLPCSQGILEAPRGLFSLNLARPSHFPFKFQAFFRM